MKCKESYERIKKKIKRKLSRKHLKVIDVILIAIVLLIGSIQIIRWTSKNVQEEQTSSISQAEQVKLNFIKKVAPIAQTEQNKYHVLASVTIAQAALESDWGQSELSQKYNNLFGIKGTGTNSAVMTTKEYVNGEWITTKASFVVYSSWNQSIENHTKLFVNGIDGDENHYAQVLNATDYRSAAQALQQTGYATDPDYAQKLISVIEKYKLYQYDR
ncbi:glycoside hydrolase family 73 protein [Ligilactobacillus cholophilus]|uniref:glycoside hydrolase family 73 protein n=1 Tax=Ligilactobacillus cholophilus TaxID=3050131 RepID=UPI0025B1774F|nr:glycoside hydrolase family 73 protein [Ligilactobacillus cholophilus]